MVKRRRKRNKNRVNSSQKKKKKIHVITPSDDGSEWEDGWETDTGDDEEQQNEEQMTPERAPATSVMKISPEDAATRTWGGKVLFRK